MVAAAVVIGGILIVGAVTVGATGMLSIYLNGYDPGDPAGYEHTTVTVVDDVTGDDKATVEAAIADTYLKRYVGLSRTKQLPANRGMLFIHDEPAERTYVMREMSFGLDIIFIGADGSIREIHTAPQPGPDASGRMQEYTGRGQYVLEVNEGWSDEQAVEPGDQITFAGRV